MTTQPQEQNSLSLTTFLTDGGLARLCAEIESLVGVRVHLHDEHGRLVTPGEGDRPWQISEDEVLDPADWVSFPLIVDEQRIGWISIGNGEPVLTGAARGGVERVLELVAATASELCTDVLELRHRITTIEVLYRLNSLLVSGFGVEEILQSTLDAAIEALELKAGSIVLLPSDSDGLPASEDEKELELAASRGLSQAWLGDPMPLGRDRCFDRRVLAGEVVEVSDLAAHDQVLNKPGCAAEGVVSFVAAGIVFQHQLIGVIRLYGGSPRSFTEQERALLRSIGQQAGVAVNQARLQLVQAEEQRIQRQLVLASDIQGRMLPQEMPRLAGLEVATSCEPCFELGGDFFDLIERDHTLGVVVGDVVGKGVAAALLMAALKSSLRAYADHDAAISSVLGRVNDAMCRDTMTHEFATVWYGLFDPTRRTLTYGSAGHDPPLLARAGVQRADEVVELKTTGLVVGVIPEQAYVQHSVSIDPGDVVVIYTDGATDATNFEGSRFGRMRLKESLATVIANQPEATAEQVLDHLRWDIRRFSGLAPQKDDETIVVVRAGDSGVE